MNNIIFLLSIITSSTIFTCFAATSASFVPRSSQLKPPPTRFINQKASSPLSSSLLSQHDDNDDDDDRINLASILKVPRGGSSLSLDEEEAEETSNIVVRKIKNIIRSIIEIGERKSPITTKLFKVMIKITEKITGLDLLPSKKKKDKKNKKHRKRKGEQSSKNNRNKNSEVEEEGDGETKADKAKAKAKAAKKKKMMNTGAAQTHLSKKIKTSNPNYRIQRELKEFLSSPPPNLSVKVGKNIRVWIIAMKGTKGSLYEGEVYRLKMTFPADYPTAPPSVYFLPPTPRHEHVYTNGDICLSLLGKDWRPTMTAQSIANSILSILSGASRKSLPMDNVAHAGNKPGGKQDDWIYHDDNC